MIEIDLSKQKALDSDPKAIQQIHLTENLGAANNIAILFIIKKAKKNILDFSQGTMTIL